MCRTEKPHKKPAVPLPESTSFAAGVWYNGAKRREAVASETVLYADVLWLINFSMDFLSLYAAGKLLSLPLLLRRMILAAAFGGIYAVGAVALGWDGIGGTLASAAVSAGMTVLAFGIREGCASFLRNVLTVWGCGALLGGIMTVFCGFAGTSAPTVPGTDLYAASALALMGLVRTAGKRMRRGYALVRCSFGETTWEAKALIDSGNLLHDPLSALPVILVRQQEVCRFAGEETADLLRGNLPGDGTPVRGLRAVPVRTGGVSRLLYGFLCPEVHILFGGREHIRRAVVCMDPEADSYGGCGLLLPASLLP